MFFFESFYYFYSLKTKLFYNEMKYIRLIFSAILLSLVVPCGYAQTRQDSLAIAHAQWHTDTLQHGAVCMYTNIHVFDSPQQISIIKYDPKKYKTQIVQAPQMTMTSHLAKENQAEAAINGSYFNVKTGAPTTFIRLDGIVRGETTRAEAFRTDGAISTDKNKIKIHAFDSITSKSHQRKRPQFRRSTRFLQAPPSRFYRHYPRQPNHDGSGGRPFQKTFGRYVYR